MVGINRLEKKENNFVILKQGFRSRRSHVICEVLLWAQRDLAEIYHIHRQNSGISEKPKQT